MLSISSKYHCTKLKSVFIFASHNASSMNEKHTPKKKRDGKKTESLKTLS